MIVIPSVDIRGGKCVRLTQGKADEETVYSDDPVAVAERWESEGGEIIHIVDLDGAFQGRPVNTGLIREIAERVSVPVELGGGMRTRDAVAAALDLGVERVIVGTKAVQSPDFVANLCDEFPGKILVSIDAKDGMATVDGWTDTSTVDAVELAGKMAESGVRAIIYTDVAVDGMLVGPNIIALKTLTDAVDVPVIASGGVGSLTHIIKLKKLDLEGVILGRSLFTGDIKLQQAIGLAKGQR